MNSIVNLIVNSVLMCLLIGGSVYAFDIPEEPGQDKVLMRYIKPQLRAFIIVYDLDGDGIGDYMTQRQIGQNYTVISQYPLYYGIDFNGNGTLDKATEVFIDNAMDGLNGNEMGIVEWEEVQKNVES